jgi:acetolactate synthase-1/2/3 large subunit
MPLSQTCNPENVLKASDLFVEALEAEQVEYIFGIPGEENVDLLESPRSGSSLATSRQPTMAASYGRLSGKPGVCLANLGPGATNLVTAAAYARLGAMPMLMITGQKPIKSSKQGHFQIVDVLRMTEQLTKLARQVVSADRIPTSVREAFWVVRCLDDRRLCVRPLGRAKDRSGSIAGRHERPLIGA